MNNSDVSAERAILASIYSHGFDAYVDCSALLNADNLTVPANQIWYAAMGRYYEDVTNQTKKLDIPTLTSIASGMGYNDEAMRRDAQEQLRAISNMPVALSNTMGNATKIKRLAITRDYIRELDAARAELLNVSGEETMGQILAKAEGRLLEFGSKTEDGDGPRKIGTGVGDYFKSLMDNPAPPGISSGFPEFDNAIGGGFCQNSLDLVVARAKTGKSLFSSMVARNVALNGIPVLYIDTEMTREEQMRRLGASLSMVPERVIKEGLFRDNIEQRGRLREACLRMQGMPYYHHYVAGMDIEEILGTIRRWMVKDVGLDGNGYVKPSLVIYDYIKLLADDNKGDNKEHQTLGFITTSLKNLIGKYQGRCLALGQQNREGLEKEDESSIAGSDRLSWFSTSTSILKWQSPEELAANGNLYTHKLIPVLSRHGGRWRKGDFINIKSNLECTHLEEGPKSFS